MEHFAEQALKEAQKYTDKAEIYLEKEQIMQVEFQKDRLDFAKEESNLGMGIRLIIDDKMGFSYTSNMDEIETAIKRAVLNSKANEKDENFSLSNPTQYSPVKDIYDPIFDSMEIEKPLIFAQALIDTVKEENCQPTSGGYYAGKAETVIMNSNGVDCREVSTGFAGHVAVKAEKNGETSTAYESDSSRFLDLSPEKIAQNACKVARDSIGGVGVKTSDMDVVLDYHAASGILSTFLNAINAENVLRGRSILANKLNQQVASIKLSVYDDATLKGGMNSASFDGEGTVSQRTPIIVDGTLKGFIYDLYNANKAHSKSTGNGIRSSFAETPVVSPSNVVIDFEDQMKISQLDDALLVNDVLGAHTTNPISGDFSVEANNAFIIKNGEITAPVKKSMLSGNIFESLKYMAAIKSEIKQIGPFILPKILIERLRVVGN